MRTLVLPLAIAFQLAACATDDDGLDAAETGEAIGVVEPLAPDRVPIADEPSVADVVATDIAAVTSGTCNGSICYHGGKIVPNRVQVYYIWYGDWTNSAVPGLLKTFAETLGFSPYYRINTAYTDSTGEAVNGRLGYGGAFHEGFTHGHSLVNSDVGAIVRDAITNGHLPYDRNGIYFVMGSRGVGITGLCTSICAWHDSEDVPVFDGHGAVELPALYGFVGNPVWCEDHHTTKVCQKQTTGPNGSSAADGMANLLAHEIAETVSDPKGNAWFGAHHAENGDLCAWTFGSEFTAPNGARANVHLGTRDWFLQRIYSRHFKRCVLSVNG